MSQFYRGLAKPITDVSSAESILGSIEANFNVTQVPAEYTYNGVRGMRQGLNIIVREDTGAAIAQCSTKFQHHQNAEIIAPLVKLAEVGGITLSDGGTMLGGQRIFLHGRVDRQFDVLAPGEKVGGAHSFKKGDKNKKGQQVGDIVRLEFSLSGSHRPGRPSVLQAMAMRLTCTNGAVMCHSKVKVRVPHFKKFSDKNAKEMTDFVEAMKKEFETYEQKAKRLLGYAMTREMTQAYVTELIQPDLLQQIAAQPVSSANPRGKVATGKDVLDAILSSDAKRVTLAELFAGEKVEGMKLDQTTKRIMGVLDTQPGANFGMGTAWQAYNAVTYFVDHVSGRGSADTAVLSQLAGPGVQRKASALDLAVEYTQRGLN